MGNHKKEIKMIIKGEYIFNGPRANVYKMFNDPNALARCVPGMEKLEKTDETHYEGVINLHMGPVNAKFSGVLSLTDENPPESCVLNVEGKGVAGFAKGVGKVLFTDLADNKTLLKYDGEANIGGTLASVGQRMIDSVMKSMIKSGCQKLEVILAERLQQKPIEAM
jgi:carbon monoxide dehydrogenase subunit G